MTRDPWDAASGLDDTRTAPKTKKIPPREGGGKRENYVNAMERLSGNAAAKRRAS